MNQLYTTPLRRILAQRRDVLLPALTQQHAWMATTTTNRSSTKKMSSRKKTIKGNRGSRGHGWLTKYREGRGGRHLQGEYWDRTQHHWNLQQWNDAVLSLGSQYVYLDIAVESPKSETSGSSGGGGEEKVAVGEEEIDIAAPEKEETLEATSAEGGAEEKETTTDGAEATDDKETLEATSEKEEETTADAADETEEKTNEWAATEETTDAKEEPAPVQEESVKIERLVIQIASTVLPETCINFIGLCQEDQHSYKDSILYRIEKEVGLCGGDVLTNTGKTGQCWQSFPKYTLPIPRPRPNPQRRDLPAPSEEPMALWHTAGTVTMLCPKVNEIDSRFVLCGKDAPHLDGIHRAFGKLDDESLEIVREWQSNVLTSFGKPKSVTLRIVDCGVLEGYDGSSSSSGPEEEQVKEEKKESVAASVSSAS